MGRLCFNCKTVDLGNEGFIRKLPCNHWFCHVCIASSQQAEQGMICCLRCKKEFSEAVGGEIPAFRLIVSVDEEKMSNYDDSSWFGSQLINFHFEYLNLTASVNSLKLHVLDSSVLENAAIVAGASYDVFNRVGDDFNRKRYQIYSKILELGGSKFKNPFLYDLLIFPVSGNSHWSTLIVYVTHDENRELCGAIIHLDSIKNHHHSLYFSAIIRLFLNYSYEENYGDQKVTDNLTVRWRFSRCNMNLHCLNCSQQINTYDCGPFAIRYVELLLKYINTLSSKPNTDEFIFSLAHILDQEDKAFRDLCAENKKKESDTYRMQLKNIAINYRKKFAVDLSSNIE